MYWHNWTINQHAGEKVQEHGVHVYISKHASSFNLSDTSCSNNMNKSLGIGNCMWGCMNSYSK